MEVTRGRGLFPAVLVRVELPSDMKLETEMDVRGLPPLKTFCPCTLNIRETPFWI